MNPEIVLLIARQFWKNVFKSRSIYALMFVMAIMLGYGAYSGWKSYSVQNDIRSHYQHAARESWESNPDKHPHRMAHYGSFAFRLKHPLSMFDFGTESFTGNAVFLEAHKQNSVNFSDASFSTGLLRFGEISMSMLFQVVIPLIIFFLGFAAVAAERETGTLKIMLTQGASRREILFGKALGLFGIALLFFVPAAIATLFLVTAQASMDLDLMSRYLGIVLCYISFLLIVSIIAIVISAASRSSKEALVKLLAIWLCFVILLPKTTQSLGNSLFPSPSRIEFESEIEKDIIKHGDSHDPDDPHFKVIKDSLLLAYNVDSVEQLPFNYSGFIMKESERLSAAIYNLHLKRLFQTYEDQNSLGRWTAFINPYLAVRNVSMALCGTDFSAYIHFQKQAEEYRYRLAQTMNELQVKYISNEKLKPGDKPYSISREHWKEFPDFKHHVQPFESALGKEGLSIAALFFWTIVSAGLIEKLSKSLNAI